MGSITENTKLPLRLVAGIVGAAIAIAGWAFKVDYTLAEMKASIARIENRLGIEVTRN